MASGSPFPRGVAPCRACLLRDDEQKGLNGYASLGYSRTESQLTVDASWLRTCDFCAEKCLSRLLVPTERVRLCPEFVGIWGQSPEFFQSWNAGTNTTVPARKYNCIVPARLQSMHHLKSIPDGNVAVVFQDAGDASRIDQLLGPLSVQLQKPFALRYCSSNKSFCSDECFATSHDKSCLKHTTPSSRKPLSLAEQHDVALLTNRRKPKPVEQRRQLLRPVSSEMEQPQSLKKPPSRALFGDKSVLNQSARLSVLNQSLKKPQLCTEAESAALDLTRWPTSSQWAPTVVLEQQAGTRLSVMHQPRRPSGAAPEVVNGPSEPSTPKAGTAEMDAIEVECVANMEVDFDSSVVTLESFVVEQPALRLAPCVPADVLDTKAAATARAAAAAAAAAAATAAAAAAAATAAAAAAAGAAAVAAAAAASSPASRRMLSTQWTVEMDEQLTEAVAKFGEGHWSEIAELVEGRTGKQCRERWKNEISSEVKKGGWTVDEDALIVACVSELGTKWSEISKHFVGRTDNAIKNRYNSEVRKYRRAEQRTIREEWAKHPQAKRPRPRQESRPSTALPRVRLKLRVPETSAAMPQLPVPSPPPPPPPPQWPGSEVPEATRVEGLIFWSMPRRPPTFEPAPRPTATTHGEAAATNAARQCRPDARRARRRSAPPPPSSAMLKPSALAAPNRGGAAEVEEQQPCSAAAAAAAVWPTHRAKRPQQLQATAHDVAEQLAATSARRSRRDKPTLEVGRRVRATFEIDRKPVWFFGAVLATASADGSLLVGFDDGKHEHMRADRLTICDDDGEV